MAGKVMAQIKCEVTIPVDCWSEKSSFCELRETAATEGIEKLRKIIRESGGSISGNPKCVFVIMNED